MVQVHHKLVRMERVQVRRKSVHMVQHKALVRRSLVQERHMMELHRMMIRRRIRRTAYRANHRNSSWLCNHHRKELLTRKELERHRLEHMVQVHRKMVRT